MHFDTQWKPVGNLPVTWITFHNLHIEIRHSSTVYPGLKRFDPTFRHSGLVSSSVVIVVKIRSIFVPSNDQWSIHTINQYLSYSLQLEYSIGKQHQTLVYRVSLWERPFSWERPLTIDRPLILGFILNRRCSINTRCENENKTYIN